MGLVISFLRKLAERVSKENKSKLYIGGLIITLSVVSLTGISGWLVERLFLSFETKNPILSTLFFAFILSSSIASRSLNKSILEVINLISKDNLKDKLANSRQKLSHIVGRDVENLDRNEILRALAETASENSVDGVFAPLFWMFLGTILWQFNQDMPGPLTLAWIFKASSTIDSMLGYKEGKLEWLGFAGAKLDDLMTWIPARIVLITLPFSCRTKQSLFNTIKDSWRDGIIDDSPNSGLSEAIFAHCAEVKMGGVNYYKGKKKIKPIIAKSYPPASIISVKRILYLSLRLQFIWLLGFTLILQIINL
tara:strand:+ start:267 stop:1193 length:927 start_codon:yes stop_codon:yes gene_type:complete